MSYSIGVELAARNKSQAHHHNTPLCYKNFLFTFKHGTFNFISDIETRCGTVNFLVKKT